MSDTDVPGLRKFRKASSKVTMPHKRHAEAFRVLLDDIINCVPVASSQSPNGNLELCNLDDDGGHMASYTRARPTYACMRCTLMILQ